MRKASILLQLLAGVALAMMVAGGVVLAVSCDDSDTCVTDKDSGGNKLGCTKGSSGDNCDDDHAECRCAGDSKGNCECD